MNEWVGRAATRGSNRIAIVARDHEAAAFEDIISATGAECTLVDPPALLAGIESADLALAVLTADALQMLEPNALESALGRQPPWSDFPFVVIVAREEIETLEHLASTLGHVAIVERPVHDKVLRNAIQAALRSRARQREAEAYLLQRIAAEDHLRQLTVTLETRIRERMRDLRAANEKLRREVDERLLAEERLRESEELYRFTLELSQQMAWTATPEGSMVTVSPRFYEKTGASPALPPNEAWLQMVHPEELARLARHWGQALRSGSEQVVQFRMRVADGSYRLFRARAAPRRDEMGAIIRWYGYTEDIHDRQQAEAARRQVEERLRESEELYRYTVELSQGIVWTAAPDGRFNSVTTRYWELTGLQPSADPDDAIHPDDRDRVREQWADAVRTGQVHHAEYRLRLHDGSYRQVRTRAAPRRDDEGNILRWYGLLEDVHEQKQAELAREEAEERYRLAAQATDNAIWDLNFLADEIRWSTSEAGFFGYPGGDRTTTIGWWEKRIHPDEREVVAASLRESMRGAKSHWAAAYRFRTASGEYAFVYDQGFIIRDKEGQAIRAVGAMADVTELKRSEAEIRRVQAELIHVSRLSAMGTMASALAHELNQPLTAVASYLRGSRRILDRVGDAAVQQVLPAIAAAEEGALRAGQMVRRLRELVARGQVSTRSEDLPKLIQEANHIGFVDEHLYGVTHLMELDPAAKWVQVDRIQVQQVLINLIRNALQAMQDQPKREVLISTSAVSRTTAEVSVADTGSGIAKEVREALFSPFQSSKAEGMGIGLSISRTIVEAHGGKIWAEDRPGGGTVFRFTLPLAKAPKNQSEGVA